MTEIRRQPALGPHQATFEAILADVKEAPPKGREIARRIFDRLRTEYGYASCDSHDADLQMSDPTQ